MDDSKAKKWLERAASLKAERSVWESHWQDIADYIHPRRADFAVTQAKGNKRMTKVFDSSPIAANELLASGFHGMLTSESKKWFWVRTGIHEIDTNPEARQWLDRVTDVLFQEIHRPQAAFSTSVHEMYLEHGAFGTSALSVMEHDSRRGLHFESRPLAEICIAEGVDGRIDTVYRTFKLSARKIVERWPDTASEKVRKCVEDNKPHEEFSIVHVLEPRQAYQYKSNLPNKYSIASVYLEEDSKTVLNESGFFEMPVMVARFYKTPGETYGRGPGMTALPDVKMLNKLAETMIRAAQKSVSPPLIVEDDSLIRPFRTAPGGVNVIRRGSAPPQPLNTNANLQWGQLMADGLREGIRQRFFVDQLQLQQGPQMTATEVLQRTESQLRLLGPAFGRLQTELLGPLIDRCYGILDRQGLIPEPPELLEGYEFAIEYTSPSAKAHKQVEAQGIARVMEMMIPVAQIDPSVMDALDGDEMMRGLADMFGVREAFFRPPEEIAEMRKQRQQQQQMAQMAQMAEQGGRAAASFAQADATLRPEEE